VNPIPRRAERLMRWSLAPWERAAVLGDLEEETHAIANDRGAAAARQWYWRQTTRSVVPNVWRRVGANLKRPDELRRATNFAAWPLWVVATTRPSRFVWVISALFAILWLVPAIYRRWMGPERPLATQSWWVTTGFCAVALTLANMHMLPRRVAFGILCLWTFWPSRRFEPSHVTSAASDEVQKPHA
jgi:hypothetical protein